MTLKESNTATAKLPKKTKNNLLAFPLSNTFIKGDDFVFLVISSHCVFISDKKFVGYKEGANLPKWESSNWGLVFASLRTLRVHEKKIFLKIFTG